jgi:predicted lipoprotein with Yx(FWY)xxD motif
VKKPRMQFAASLAVVLAIAGCGSSSSSSSPASPTSPATPARSTSGAAASSSYGSASSYSSGGGSTTAAAGRGTAVITTKHSKLGTILAVGAKRITVYMFEADKGSASSCNGACAQTWPPVVGSPKSSGGAVMAELATIKRSDGRMQVTYKGHPLYTFAQDRDEGDAYGQAMKAFGADWYVLRPSGAKVDES